MKVKYKTAPPIVVTNIPHFLFKKYARGIVSRMVAWAQKEYYDAIIELYATMDAPIAKYYEDNYTYLDFIAHSKTFREIAPMIQEDVWAQFDRKTQDILIGARNIMVSGSMSRQ
jgi:hypothetical protein